MPYLEPPARQPLTARLIVRLAPRMMRKLTGRDPQLNDGMEPLRIWAHRPKLMRASLRFSAAVQKPVEVEERIHNLVHIKGASMIGCEYCIDLGSQICRNSGFSDAELLALGHYADSELFDEREKAALDFTVAVMRTPVEMSEETFARIRSHFSPPQLVELAALLMLVNGFRINAAFGIGSAGFSEGMVCAVPERPPLSAVAEPVGAG